MIIDFHTHTFPDKIAPAAVAKLQETARIPAWTDGTNAGLSASTKAAGVDISVVLPVATSTKQVPSINEKAAETNRRTADTGVLSLGCIHPDYEDWHAELGRFRELGLKGFKIHPVYQRTNIHELPYLRILERAGELDLVVAAHCGVDMGYPDLDFCSPPKIRRAMEQVGPVKFVAAHMGAWKNWNQVADELADLPIMFDTSFSGGTITPLTEGALPPEECQLLREEEFVRLVRLYGAHRVLFGTDSPWTDQAQSLAWIRALPLTEEEKAAILGGNAQKLLKL